MLILIALGLPTMPVHVARVLLTQILHVSAVSRYDLCMLENAIGLSGATPHDVH